MSATTSRGLANDWAITDFETRTLTGADSLANASNGNKNRFAGTWLGEMPVPLPKNYVQGIDTQKLDFERGTAFVLARAMEGERRLVVLLSLCLGN